MLTKTMDAILARAAKMGDIASKMAELSSERSVRRGCFDPLTGLS